jgi:hypothetical protein
METEVHLCFYIKNNYIINIIHLIINVEIKIVVCLSDWIPLHSPHPNIYKFVHHIKGIDQKNSLRIIEYRKNPIDYVKWSLPSKQVKKETKLQRLMTAYKISLFDDVNALASNIEVIQFIDNDFAIDYEEVEIEVEEETMNCTIQEIEEMSLSNNAHKLVNTNYIVKLFV